MAHIPDGFLSIPVTATTLAGAAALTGYAARKAQAGLDERAAPTLGLATAGVFAAQALNFPVIAGTSGHLLGCLLVAVIFGPWMGYLVMTAVLIVQALIFADGGLTAIGANLLNIAGIGSLGGYAIYRALIGLAGTGPRRCAAAAAVAAFIATLLTGVAAGLELGLSTVAPARLAVGAMAGVHAVMGVAEGIISALVVWALVRKRPELLYELQTGASRSLSTLAVRSGLAGLAMLAGALSLLASSAPDALERLAGGLGFADVARRWSGAPFSEYTAWLSGPAGTALAVVLGLGLLFAGVTALVRVLAMGRHLREG